MLTYEQNKKTQTNSTAAGPVIHVIEDDLGVRRSIASLLATLNLNVNTYENANEAIKDIDVKSTGCLILDMRLPDRDGLDLLEELRQMGAKMPAIIITAYADVPAAVRAMKMNVSEFLEKPFSEQQFIAAVQKAVEKDQARVAAEARHSDQAKRVSTLSDREKDVLRGVIAGKSSKMIADDLGISAKTVENYRAKLMSKIGAENSAHLVSLVYGFFNQS